MESLLHGMGCRYADGRPNSAPELRTEGGTNTFLVKSPTVVGAPARPRLAQVRWADLDETAMSSESIKLLDVRVNGLPHQRELDVIASMQCDNIYPEDVDRLEELDEWVETILPHNDKCLGWSLSQDLPNELEETAEPVDPLVHKGTELGSTGKGKGQIFLHI